MSSSEMLSGSLQGAGALDNALLGGRPAFFGFLAKRLGNKADAEDVLQEFCVRVLAKKDQLREADRVQAWLYAVLRSTLNDFYRNAGRSQRLGAAFVQEQKGAEITSDASEAYSQICACVRSLVPELRPADAELVRRVDLENEVRKSVASDMGLASGTLSVRLHRARLALRDKLLGHCGYCCQHGFEDCSCSSAGCHNAEQGTDCAP